MRIGHGFDVHRFGPGNAVVLGGVTIPFEQGFVAHSDGDVLIHALCDALLGALGEGDIGHWFPDSDPQFAGMDSRHMLRRVMAEVEQRGLTVANADCTLVGERPRLAPHRDTMRANLAQDLRVSAAQVNVKATTTERLGYLGRGEGVAAHAVVLLVAAPAEAVPDTGGGQ